jgi:hypothetical protein
MQQGAGTLKLVLTEPLTCSLPSSLIERLCSENGNESDAWVTLEVVLTDFRAAWIG